MRECNSQLVKYPMAIMHAGAVRLGSLGPGRTFHCVILRIILPVWRADSNHFPDVATLSVIWALTSMNDSFLSFLADLTRTPGILQIRGISHFSIVQVEYSTIPVLMG